MKDGPAIVYKTTNRITGEFYIGHTTMRLNSRMSSHRAAARTPGFLPNSRFYAAAREYGWDAFDTIVLADTETRAEAIEIETELTDEAKEKTPHLVYNSDSGNTPCAKTKERISEASIGRKASEETKAKLRLRPQVGRKHSEEVRSKISKANKGRKHSEEARRRMSLAKKGKKGTPLTAEAKRKLSEAKKGRRRCYSEDGRCYYAPKPTE